jgi:hypothetical protein
MPFPATLTNAVDGVTENVAAHLNNLEAKVGIDNSAVATSFDYLLKNAASIEPGHKHSKLWAADGDPEAVSVDAAGNVGVGTTSPGSKLHVSSPAMASEVLAQFFASGMANTNYIDLYLGKSRGMDLAGTISFVPQAAAANSYLQFGLYGTQGPFVVGKNNVGIGTTSPGAKLEVNGAIWNSETTFGLAIGSKSGVNRIDAGGGAGQPFRTLGVSDGYTGFRTRQISIGSNYASSDAPLEGMIIEGHVGIGTTSPGKKLDVAGYIRAIGLFNTLNSAPPDGDLAAGECAWWFDKTDGAAKLMIKAKQNDGTIKTASISLS